MTFAQKRLSVVAIATTLVLALALGGLAGGFAPEQAFADEPAADQAAAICHFKDIRYAVR